MFIRTSGKSFNGMTKSESFGSKLHSSYQFGGRRAVLCGTVFSYGINFSSGYSFIPAQNLDRGWRGAFNINHDECVETLFKGTGLVSAEFKFDGSGDSGDFDCEQILLTIQNSDVISSAGILEATNPAHDLVIHNASRWGRTPSDIGFASVIEQLAYSALENQYGGWEINSGSHGSVTIDGDGISIDYNQSYYVCDRCDEEYTDDEPCSCVNCPDCGSPTDGVECEECQAKIIDCTGIDGNSCKYENKAIEKDPVCWLCLRDLEEKQRS